MWKTVIIILIIVFGLFASVTNLITQRKYQNAQVVIADIRDDVSRTLNVDQVGPALSKALDQVDIDLPAITKEKSAYKGDSNIDNDLSATDFTAKSFVNANFNGAFLSQSVFHNAIIEAAGFEGAHGLNVNFINARMKKSNLSASIFSSSDFSGVELTDAIARAASFTRAKFIGADLSFGKFSGSDFSATDLSGAYGVSAVFNGANFEKAILKEADLSGVRFVNANLQDAVFTGTDLRLADFTGARLPGADLSQAKNLDPGQIGAACIDAQTKLPEGMTAPYCE